MLTINIFKAIDEMIPKELALKEDKIGYFGINYQNSEIKNIKVMMDILPKNDDSFNKGDLVITHHPPIFTPRTPTYTVHTNWDVYKGGSSDALAKSLNLKVMSTFDITTGLGRICSCYRTLEEILNTISQRFNEENTRVINGRNPNKIVKKIAILAGNGLSNLNYIKLAKERNVDVFISGDLNHQSSILAEKLNLTLIDLSYYYSEIPGLYALADLISSIGIPIEVIDSGVPWDYIKNLK
ncbi:MAG: Nif3-like dinuclear metal center hexameric protein [Methanobacteriaceae archaeon]|jgi:dinuclear metal center YbgI/SA1388 family protein|uniref:Nif3-like dinuclear metal center hexameric protein n=1 Tax=unclassified Methanobrevibacter TaxID=2638681 RepID=UPI002A0B5F08|nr:Nif3-like dinuclear metal center hexameric protein [Methanobacteriaceae archaeon]MDD3408685.1 Nif3-like dinuclear metal center hexameric protein [Methanobacteriaceae archaeon]MDD4593579.1 Nif3-like dinuclear metal center hexameric protein [Methanobacteriaceae archaeon]